MRLSTLALIIALPATVYAAKYHDPGRRHLSRQDSMGNCLGVGARCDPAENPNSIPCCSGTLCLEVPFTHSTVCFSVYAWPLADRDVRKGHAHSTTHPLLRSEEDVLGCML